MKKINKVIKKNIYTLDEEDKKALRRVYNLLDGIQWDMSVEDAIEFNGNSAMHFEWGELNILCEELEEFLKADFFTLTRE